MALVAKCKKILDKRKYYSKTSQGKLGGPVVRKVGIALSIVIFEQSQEAMTPGILNSQEIKIDLNSKILYLNRRFSSCWACV